MGLSLRAATAADDGVLHAVYAGTREDEMAIVPWTDAQKAAFVRQQYEAQRSDYERNYPDAEWLVVERDGRPVGRMIVHRGCDEILLMDVALLPHVRGAGNGTELIRSLMAESVATGKPIRLHVETFNPALAWYERLGFEHVRVINGVYVEMLRRPSAAGARKAGR